VQSYFPALDGDALGKAVSFNGFLLSLVGASLPVLILAPLALRAGKVLTHSGALFVMAAGYFGLYFFGGHSLWTRYALIAIVGIGWSAIVSLPFAIMSQKVDGDQMGMFMGLFNLSVMLPQLTVSLGIASLIAVLPDKNSIWMISAIAMLFSACAWLRVEEDATETDTAAIKATDAGGHI